MKIHYVLIDFENVQVKSLALLKGDNFKVKVFIGPKNTKLPVELVLAMQKLGESAEYIMLQVSGANALDFHITYYLGRLTAKHPEGCFHIISKDTGFDSLIKHVNSKKIECRRSVSIEAMTGIKHAPVEPVPPLPVSKPAPPKAPVPKAPPAKAPPAKVAPNKPKKAVAKAPAGEAVKAVVEDLIKRKASLPATRNSLLNTMGNKLKGSSAEQLQAVLDDLMKQGLVKINGSKVSYSLPVGL